MAEASATSDSKPDPAVLQRLFPEDTLRCPVCLDYFVKPKILPCAHIICAGCLINWLQTHNQQSRCPVCRAKITSRRLSSLSKAEEIEDALATEETIHAMVVAHKVLQGPHVCSKCGEEANSFCFECYLKYCKKCRRKHTKATNKKVTKVLAKRETTLAAEAAGDGATSESLTSQSSNLPATLPYVPPRRHRVEMLASLNRETICSQSPSHCKTHTTEENNYVDYYCDTHSALLCLCCVKEGGHQDCEFKTIQAKAAEARQDLRERSVRLEKKKEKLDEEKKKILQQEQEAKALAAASRAEIESVMDQIKTRMKEMQDKFLQELVTMEKEGVPIEECQERQAAMLRSLKDDLHNQISLGKAEAAIRRFDEYTRETSSRPGPAGAQPQRQRVHHHHQPHQRRSHHNHQHQRQGEPGPSVENSDSTSAATAEVTEDITNFFQNMTGILKRPRTPVQQEDHSPTGDSD